MTDKKDHSQLDKIIIKGARTHNLKDISVEMPRNKMIVFTGLSGSGKSSLAFDTIFAEGQRRYVESLSSYARQFLRQFQKPDVDDISGLSPAISIDQKSRSNNPRSTVATITEIYDYLRVLYARIGKPHCLLCGSEITKLSHEEIVNHVQDRLKKIDTSSHEKKIFDVSVNTFRISIFTPLVRGRKGEYYQLLYDMLGKGYLEARVDGKMKKLREQIALTKNKKHTIDILVDRLDIAEMQSNKKNFDERLAESIEHALNESDGLVIVTFGDPESPAEEFVMSSNFSCPNDGFSYPEIEPRLFSFNSPYGACQACNGLGTKYFLGTEECEVCNGKRLRPEALNVIIRGKLPDKEGETKKTMQKNIVEIAGLSIADAYHFFNNLELSERDEKISEVLLREIKARLLFMIDVGIEYLTLDRRANTLSGGEAQRIRLASQLGSRLVGALYVLDEPTIGLHARDNDRLVKTLLHLRDIGNTIIVVEHDEDTIYAADYLVDIGPGAGVHGGEVVVSGNLEELLMAKTNPSHSTTLDYLRGDKEIAVPETRRTADKGTIKIKGANIFNIKNQDAEIPLGKMVCVTGVSGSGKSTFLYEVLHKNLQARFERRYRSAQTFNCAEFSGTDPLGRVIMVDQSPIGRTPRSNPATYTGSWTFVRELFAGTAEARVRGWRANRFSFNVKGGRCETCQGNGEIAVEMHFLPTVYVPCDVCRGKRFMKETLEVKYKDKTIYDILKMTVEEALEFFRDIPAIYDRLNTLNEVGLGYLELGQSATTLSGGESQRVKISSELYRFDVQKTIYLLDEPTIGLHYDDVKKLLEILDRLVEKGNTVVLIEHNLDVIKNADYILDIGPEGGVGGGKIIARGTPEDVANTPGSYTGKYLKKALRSKKKGN